MGRRLHSKIMAAVAVAGLGLATGVTPAPGDEQPPEAPGKAAPEAAEAASVPLPTVGALPPPGELDPPAPFPAVTPVGTLDEAVEPAQAAGGKAKAGGPKPQAGARKVAQVPAPTPLAAPAGDGLPGASAEAPGHHAATAPRESEPSFVLPAERLPLGRQSVGLTVDVVAPQVLNINQVTSLKVVVRNHGQTDALGVVVRDVLPEALAFLSSQPEAQKIDALLSWPLGTLPAGTERVITLSVKATRVGSFDHAATVTMMAGGKSRTMVREPKLKVEQSAVTGKVLKGQPVQFKIAVSNPGDGPVRNVTVQAKLSPGLRHESGEPNDQNLFEQTIEMIEPGQRVPLDTLVADTLQRGEQTCLIVAQSPDVIAGSADARSLQSVTVVEPELKVTLRGPEKRFTEMLAPYELTLENPGTAAARNVRAQVILPLSGRLYQVPPGASFDPKSRKLSWTRPQLDPGEKAVLPFSVRMGGVGLYSVAAEARADGVAQGKDVFQTDVEGMADVNFVVTEKRRVVDVDGQTIYAIKIDNAGTKDATRLLVTAVLSENVKAEETGGTDEHARTNPTTHELVFPVIERLPPGETIELSIKVRAVKPGIASCRVFLTHEEMTDRIDAVARFTVVPTRR